MDGLAIDEFDMIDAFIASHYIDPGMADEAMALDPGEPACWSISTCPAPTWSSSPGA